MSRVAFLGLGAIGTPMARHLAIPAHDLVVWNRTRARSDAFVTSTPARIAASPAEAAAGRDIVITCLPVSRDVEGLLDGPDGLLATMPAGSVLVDCTSGDPATSRRMAARLDGVKPGRRHSWLATHLGIRPVAHLYGGHLELAVAHLGGCTTEWCHNWTAAQLGRQHTQMTATLD